MTYKYMFSVTGSGQFPVDMLRYDRCSPLTETDSAKIIASMEHGPDRREIAVTHFGTSAGWAPTYDRWRSFGWTVNMDTERRERFA